MAKANEMPDWLAMLIMWLALLGTAAVSVAVVAGAVWIIRHQSAHSLLLLGVLALLLTIGRLVCLHIEMRNIRKDGWR